MNFLQGLYSDDSPSLMPYIKRKHLDASLDAARWDGPWIPRISSICPFYKLSGVEADLLG